MTQWTFRRATVVLVVSVTVTFTLSFGSYFLHRHRKITRLSDAQYFVTTLIQTGSEKEALKTTYLAELLGLSADRPINLYALDENKAAAALLSSPLIVRASVERRPPAAIYVDYEVRKPVAWVADYKNIALDAQGYLFPMAPFFPPQQMPEMYLGLPPFGAPVDSFGREGGRWKVPLRNKHLELALEVLHLFEGSSWKEGLQVKQIDVSNAFAPTLGRREIVLFTEEELSFKPGVVFTFPKILRLAPHDYAAQLQNFFSLRKTMLDDYRKQLISQTQSMQFAPRIVDLRIGQLAFVENTKNDS